VREGGRDCSEVVHRKRLGAVNVCRHFCQIRELGIVTKGTTIILETYISLVIVSI